MLQHDSIVDLLLAPSIGYAAQRPLFEEMVY